MGCGGHALSILILLVRMSALVCLIPALAARLISCLRAVFAVSFGHDSPLLCVGSDLAKIFLTVPFRVVVARDFHYVIPAPMKLSVFIFCYPPDWFFRPL